MLPQFSFSSAEMKRIRRVQFGVINPEEMKAMSVVEVTKPGTYNAGVPIRNGLNDPAMGACDLRSTCSTCKNTYSGTGKVNDCPGHFGHLELASPVWHIGFLPVLYKLMQCVCINCSRLLVDKNSLDFQRAASISNGKKRLMALLRLCRGRRQCKGNTSAEGAAGADGSVTVVNEADVGCGAYQPNFRREGLKISLEFKEEHMASAGAAGGGDSMASDRKQVLSPERAYSILRNVSNEDVKILGLNPKYARPEWLIVTVLPVAPPHVRPSVALDSLARADDDVTHKYADIVKANTTVSNAKKSGQPAVVVQQYEAVLQYHVATLVDNSVPGLPNATQRGGKQLKTFRERLVGKMGRVRGNLMGKRVDFSARTVITADPNLSIHQVGVPRSIASNLTVPERVNRYNIRRLQQLVERGPHEHPGCKYIIRDNGLRIDLRHAKSANDLTLKYGYVVERHLMDDDTVLFNRQPTLHKMSIMCHKAKVLDYSTFRLNLTCTTPYNADFDGDEMNMHALQTLPAIAEASELMIVPRLIITAQANRPVMGIVQDTLLGSRLFTYRDVFVPMDVLMCAVLWMSGWDGKLPQPAVMKPVKGKPGKHVPLWTGKQIFSMFIPEVNYSTASQRVKDSRDDLWAQDGQVLIEKGQLLMGMLDKASLGNKGGSLLHVIMNDVSPEDCRDFINTTQRVVNYWLLHRGFSIGIGDAEAPTATMMQVSRTINEAKDKVKGILQKAQISNGLQRQPGQTMMMSFEALVNEVLNRARDQASNAVTQVLDERSNAVLTMVAAGSKGSDNNISQIIACVAQQNIDGSRIGYGFRDRTLPHFTKFDLGPIARGFVENSYLKGLTPSEFFFHTMAGRVGLIDTAVKTAETGYIQRRLVKAMEDAMVRYDGTVRNSCNEVVQFLYGEDGMDARWIENNDFPSYKCSMGELRDRYEWNPDHPSFGRAGPNRELFLDPNVQEDMRMSLETRDELAKEFELIQEDRRLLVDAFQMSKTMDKDVTPMPLAVSRMILNVKRRFRISSDKGGTTDMHPVRDVIQPLNALLDRLVIVPGSDRLAKEAQDNATSMLRVLLRSQLASKRVMQHHRLTKEAFRTLLGEIETRFNISVAAAGEMCGVLAAQSLGEPATQMTLNTFHHAGVSAKNVTLGMPRLKELINIAKHIRTPSLTIFVNSELRRDEALALDRLQQVLEYITLNDLVEETRILYDPDTSTTVIEEDKLFVETYALAPDEGINLETLSPWVLRLRLSRERMGNRLIRLDEVKAKVKEVDPTLDVVDNGVNAPVPVLRIRISNSTRAVAAEAEEDAEAAAAREAAGSTGDEDEKTLRDFEQFLLNDLPLRGIPGVKKLFKGDHKAHVWTPEGGVKPAPKEPKFETEGSSLLRVLNLPEVDHTRTFCNDIIEILLVLGIEACRQSLLNELRAVISFDGTYVNYRHMALLVDTMTFRGSLTAVTRHGINRVDSGPLIRSSFEETCEILMEAAAFAEVDEMRGASSNIMLGQMAPIGTGHCDILLDEDKLQEAIPVDVVTQELMTGAGNMLLAAEGSGSVYVSSNTPLLASSPTDMVGGAPGLGTGQSPYSQSMYGGGSGMTPGGPQFSPSSWTPQGAAGGALTPASFSPGAGLSGGYVSGALSPATGLGGGGMSPSQYAMAYTGGYNYGPTSPMYGGGAGGSGGGAAGGAGGYYGVQSPAFSGDVNSEYSPNTGPSMGATPMLSTGMSPATSFGSGSAYTSGVGGSSAYSSGTGMSSAMQSNSGGGNLSGMSPASPYYSPTSPGLGLASAAASRPGGGGGAGGAGGAAAAGGFSSQYSPTSPGFSPSGSTAFPGGAAKAGSAASPAYSPTSPAFSPSGGGPAAAVGGAGASKSPAYSPTSPAFSPSSGAGSSQAGPGSIVSGSSYSPSAAMPGGSAASTSGGASGYSPTSPGYSPSAPPGGNSSSSSSSGNNNGGYSPQNLWDATFNNDSKTTTATKGWLLK